MVPLLNRWVAVINGTTMKHVERQPPYSDRKMLSVLCVSGDKDSGIMADHVGETPSRKKKET